MAVYRSDQTQLTFGVEAAQGGYPELASGAVTDGTGSGRINNTTGYPAGTRHIVFNNGSSLAAGEFIQIGPEIGSGSDTYYNSEVRKIEYIDGTSTGTITLDAPTGFYHPHETVMQVVTAVPSDVDVDKYITQIPGIYESADLPDPEMAIEPAYFLGTASKRNFHRAYSSTQTFSGAISDFVLLNGRSLRFPIGSVATLPIESDGSTHAIKSVAITINQNGSAGSATAPPAKGDIYITVSGSHGLVADDYIVIYGAASTSSAEAIATAEVRKVIAVENTNTLKLQYPLQFAHAHGDNVREVDSSLSYYQHTITETVDLDSLSLHAHMRASDELATRDFDRRYYGGKIGSASISGEEGGMLSMSWDGMSFLGMLHNQQTNSNGSVTVPFYSLMKTIDSGDVVHPTSEPYYFSQGDLTMFGQTIARVRSFEISINNNLEENFYISKQLGRKRGPLEIREGRREYSMSATIALPDAGVASTAARTLFNELLLEGDYGTKTGFAISLVFTRGTKDTITITIPDDGTAAAGGDNQGAFLRSAPHNIGTDNPFQVDADILFRSMKIVVEDTESYYP